MRRDDEVRAEESCFLAPKTPGHIGRVRVDSLKVNAPRKENVEPGFGRARLRAWRVGLDFDFAGINMDVVELPASEEYSPRIKPGCDAMRIDRVERLAAVVSLKAV